MATKPNTSDSLPTVAPTRRDPRFSVGSGIRCEVQGPDVAVTLLNLSRDGFLVSSPLKTRVGAVQRYRFMIETEEHYIFVLRARVVHCGASTTDGTPSYLTDLLFLDTATDGCRRAIDRLIGVVGQ
jgi:hypothetical protein